MNTKSELARLAANAGVNQTHLALGLGLVVLGAIFYFRRPILRVVKFFFNAVLAIIGGVGWVYNRFGLVYAGGFIVAVVLFVFVAGRSSHGAGGGSGHDDDYVDQLEDDLDRRNREHELREAERIHRNHYG